MAKNNCICSWGDGELGGNGRSTCGFVCPEHYDRAIDHLESKLITKSAQIEALEKQVQTLSDMLDGVARLSMQQDAQIKALEKELEEAYKTGGKILYDDAYENATLRQKIKRLKEYVSHDCNRGDTTGDNGCNACGCNDCYSHVQVMGMPDKCTCGLDAELRESEGKDE